MKLAFVLLDLLCMSALAEGVWLFQQQRLNAQSSFCFA